MPASLRRTVQGWRRDMYSAYTKEFHDHDGNASTVAVMMAVEDTPGPSLVMPLARMSRRKVRSRFGGMDQMGYGTTVLDGDGSGCVFRTIAGSETAAQLDELAQCMVDDATYWVEHHAPRPRRASQPAGTATTALQPVYAPASQPMPTPQSQPVPQPMQAAPAAPAPTAPTAATPPTTIVFPKRFCTQCGAKLPPNARFCGACGAQL